MKTAGHRLDSDGQPI